MEFSKRSETIETPLQVFAIHSVARAIPIMRLTSPGSIKNSSILASNVLGSERKARRGYLTEAQCLKFGVAESVESCVESVDEHAASASSDGPAVAESAKARRKARRSAP